MISKIPLEQLSVFAGSLATCLSAGIGVPQSLRTSTRSSSGAALQGVARAAAERAEAGSALSDSLASAKDHFPTFFLPVLRCGEQVGRLDEALRYLEQHCVLLARPTRMMRNTWLFPLVIVLAGSIVKMAGYAILAPAMEALAYFARTLTTYGLLAMVVAFFHVAPQAKRVLDHAKLSLPVLGQAERELAVNRFFHSFNLLYSTGGARVEEMVKLAVEAVGNVVVADDLLRAAAVIEARGTITDAFAAPNTIAHDHKAIIAAGDEGGKLEEAIATICRLTDESVRHRLTMFNRVFFRVVVFAVTFSIVATLYSLTMTTRPGH